jgi:predicted transcriptional regulator
MKRTTVFLTEELEHELHELSRRIRRPQSEIFRQALTQYLATQKRPWPRSIGMGKSSNPEVSSENVKEWVREQWRRDAERGEGGGEKP